MKILFLVLHRMNRSPGQRYRSEQYLKSLENEGLDIQLSPLLNEKDDHIFYRNGNIVSKLLVGIKATLRRLNDVFRAGDYDYIYIYRDAFFFWTFFERLFAKSKAKIIYDFDDAIWLMDKNPNQGIFNRLKNPDKVSKLVSLADIVIVGNEYLASYAHQFNANVKVVPSTIDFKEYKVEKKKNQGVCIGWTGSFSTVKHFETVVPALLKIRSKYRDKIYFKLIGDPGYSNDELSIKGTKWIAESEAEDLSELDIGLMPLPDNDWTRGKCAMKGLQYMALEIPTIMSPVGVNKDIIQDGLNGFLASSTEEWVEKLSQLIESPELRQKLGKAGRKTVEKDYSVEANKDKWLAVFQS